jgi:hypothetical protein
MSAKAAPEIDQDELVDELAKSLGVEEPPALLPAAPAELLVDQPATEIAQPALTPVSANGDGRAISSEQPADPSSPLRASTGLPAEALPAEALPAEALAEAGGPVLAPVAENNGDASKSIVPTMPNADEAESVKPAQANLTPQPENANQQ